MFSRVKKREPKKGKYEKSKQVTFSQLALRD